MSSEIILCLGVNRVGMVLRRGRPSGGASQEERPISSFRDNVYYDLDGLAHVEAVRRDKIEAIYS